VRRFEFVQGASSKFWQIDRQGSTLFLAWGRLGGQAQTKTRNFPSEAAAQAEYDRLIREKTSKGYLEVDAAPFPPTRTDLAPVPASPGPGEAPAMAFPRARSQTPAGLHWTPAARLKVHPWRGDPAPAPAPKADIWKRVGRALGNLEGLRQGVGLTTPTLRGPFLDLLSRLSTPPPARPLSREQQAMLLALLGYPSQECAEAAALLLHHWVSVGGCAQALEILLASWSLELRGGFFSPIRWLTRRTSPGHMAFEAGHLGPWRVLRQALAVAPAADYDQARARARRAREGAPLALRCALSYAFPEEAEGVRADLAELEEQPPSGPPWRRVKFPPYGWSLLSCLDDAARAEELLSRYGQELADPDHAYTLLHRLGPAAVPALALLNEKLKEAGQRGTMTMVQVNSSRRAVAEALALVESPRAAEVLGGYLADRPLAQTAADYFRRFPRLGLETLPVVAAGRGRPAQETRSLLAGLVRQQPDLAREVLPRLAGSERALLQGLLGKARTGAEEAGPAELPPVLAEPPWRSGREAPPPRVVQGLAVLEYPESVQWAGPVPRPYVYDRPPKGVRGDAEQEARLEKEFQRGQSMHRWYLERLSDEPALRVWNGFFTRRLYLRGDDQVTFVLARFGVASLPGFLKLFPRDSHRTLQALAHVCSARVAPLMAEGLAHLKTSRPLAREWLTRFPEAAAVGLIPSAVGPPGRAREVAEEALRFLARQGRRPLIEEVAARYGPQAAAAVGEVLDLDPLLAYPDRLPRMPDFWNPETLPRPLLRGRRKALPLEAVQHLGTMLAFSPLDPPYAGLEQVKAACDADSLEEFAWELFESWLRAGAPARESWAFLALAHLGGDKVVGRLTPLIRRWPSQQGVARAQVGVDVLAGIGSDLALMSLDAIARLARHKTLQEKARAKIEEVAAGRGLSPDELADRLTPDLGLGPDGSLELDFGPRRFRVGFDEKLKPFVCNDEGVKLAGLPRPAATDDAPRAEEAAARWKALKHEAQTVAAPQIRRLEMAMCGRRRWDAHSFRTFLVEHPLLTHLARRLLWGVYDDQGRLQETFRVAQDRTLADVEEAPCQLAPQARVGLVHPLDMEAALLQRWTRLFADHKLAQPFPQLGRSVYPPRPEEMEATHIDRAQGKLAPPARVLRLESRGWRRGGGEEGGFRTMERAIGAGTAVLVFEPGISAADPTRSQVQTLGPVHLYAGPPDEGARLRVGDLDPVLFSEIVAHALSILA
jgi:predicted DNA-binding WGR domain protein